MTFFGTFLMCLIGIIILIFFCSMNVWVLLVVAALLLAGMLTAYVNLAERVEQLEKQLPGEAGADTADKTE